MKPELTLIPEKARSRNWSHRKELDAMIGQSINVVLTHDKQVRGILLHVDAFAISFQIENPHILEGKSVLTYFLHAIVGYEVIS